MICNLVKKKSSGLEGAKNFGGAYGFSLQDFFCAYAYDYAYKRFQNTY